MKRFIIIDDSAFTRSVHKNLLAQAGYDSVEADGPSGALAVLESESVDGALIDLLMPDGDGVELIGKLRERHPSLPIIVCSADQQRVRQEDVRNAGASAFIGKPLNGEKLEHALALIFEDTSTSG